MSGSGGGGGGGGGGTPVSDCASLNKVTTLNSAIPKVVRALSVNDRLIVTLDPGGTGRVDARLPSGDLAGSLTFSGVGALRKCLEEGWQFVARVREITGGDVTVEVRHAAH